MAQTMGQIVRNYSPEFDKVPPAGANTVTVNGGFEFADQTASTTAAAAGAGDFGATGFNYFKATVHLKTFTAGTGSSAFTIDVADDTAFTTNKRTIAVGVVPFTAGAYCVYMSGVCPDGAKRYARVGFIAGAGASGTFDAFLGGCP